MGTLVKKNSNKRMLSGTVVSNKMQKTAVVKVERRIPHYKYKKIIKTNKKYYAHNEKGDIAVGDSVTIIESRPISKLKRWVVFSINKVSK